MPACNKDAFIDDFVQEPDDVIEETYGVSIHAEDDGGRSHTESKHGPTVSLEDRFQKERHVNVATKFDSREAMWASRHRWLERFARDMHSLRNLRPGQRFIKTMNVGEVIGHGITRDHHKLADLKQVTFVFEWDVAQKRWFEISGRPSNQRHVDATWKKA